jgi:4-amino-4-deoxy-L-arabinose transferase-like glycosyltransferase
VLRTGAGLVAAAALLLLFRLGATDLWAPDEPRYAEVAEEIRSFEHGPAGLVLLHVGGAPYTQKPPLYYWLAALAGAAGGRVTEVAARLPSALSGIALVALTLAFGRSLFPASPAAGPWSALVLLGVHRFVHLARRAQLDVLLALCEALALLAFWRLDRGRGSRRGNAAALHGALGLAVLVKGPVGLLPLAVAAAYLAWERRLGRLRDACPPWAWLLSLGPGLAWLAGAVALAPNGFFDAAVVDNLLGRFFAGTSHVRPFYYFAYQFPLDFLPWTLLWPLAWGAARRGLRAAPERAAPWRFLLSWLGVFLVFFSLSAGKRGLYLLPAFPAAALLCGAAVDEALGEQPRLPRWLGIALAVPGALLFAGGLWILASGGVAPKPGSSFRLPAEVGAAWSAAVAVAAVACWALRSRPARVRLAVVATAWLLCQLVLFAQVYPLLDPEKSPRPIARAAARLAGPGGAIGLFEHGTLAPGLLYYGRRPVVPLLDPEGVRRFVDSGGRVIVARRERVGELATAGDFEVRASVRSGRRELLALVPKSAPPTQVGPSP